MFEKCNPAHPDKIMDRIAGALVDIAYKKQNNPEVAIEGLIGHGNCFIINETSCHLTKKEVKDVVKRIAGDFKIIYQEVPQDIHLANNQKDEIRCGDNGIFRGVPVSVEQERLNRIARKMYAVYHSDGKYVLDGDKLIICQSNVETEKLQDYYPKATINPLGDWTGSTSVDTGAINRKIGSDMADSATGGGLHGKDLSKGDVSINIYAWLKAQILKEKVEISCAIGDNIVDGRPYSEIVSIAKQYIDEVGGFEKFAEWGLVRPWQCSVKLSNYKDYFEE